MCLNSECYEKRTADLAKTDIDQALEVCGAWERANRLRDAQEDARHAGPGSVSAGGHGGGPMPPTMDRYGPPHGYHPGASGYGDEMYGRGMMYGGPPEDDLIYPTDNPVFFDDLGRAYEVRRRRNYQRILDLFRNRHR